MIKNLLLIVSITLCIKTNAQVLQANMPGVNDQVSCIARYQNTVFISGSFTLVDTVTRASVAAIDAITGAILPWYPDPTGGYVGKIIVANNKLIVFGSFSGVSGAPRNRIAVYSLPALTLLNTPALDTLYPWGPTCQLGTSIYYLRQGSVIKRFDSSTLLPDTSFHTDYTNVDANSMTTMGNYVYIGGYYVYTLNKVYLERYDIQTGIRDTSFNFNIPYNNFGQPWINQVLGYNGKIYITGSFDQINGLSRRGIAEINASGAVTGLDIYCSHFQNYGLFAQGNTLWIGGNSAVIGNGNTFRISQVGINTGISTCWHGTSGIGNQGAIRTIYAQHDTVYLGGDTNSPFFNPFSVIVGNQSYINIGNDTTMCPASPMTIYSDSAFNTFIWNTSATTSSITVNSPGNYWVTATRNSGCEATDSIIVQGCTGFETYFAKNELLYVYPSISGGNFSFEFSEKNMDGELKIYNLFGNLVFREAIKASSSSLKIDLSNLSNGMYFCNVQWRNLKTQSIKIIKT